MAAAAASSCGGAGCGPHCSSSASAAAVEDAAAAAAEKVGRLSLSRECGKCGGGAAAVAVAGGLGLCGECFRANLLGKFKLAVTSNAMVRPTDSVLLAFSGGPASRVALQFIHEMRCKAIESWDVSNSQALPVFGVGVAFVDESVLCSKPRDEIEMAIEDIRSIVSSLSTGVKAMHIARLEDVFSTESEDGERRLREAVDMIGDDTGREDFLRCLRMLSLQKIAMENGYAKIMLGSCASAIACHVLSATVKGQGYSLPADVQYVDTRWEIPVVLPLRDCLAQELTLLCELDSLKTQQHLDRPLNGINSLVASFIKRLREENPSREHTIVRTAQKLKPFSFNKFSADGYHDFLPSRLRPKFQKFDSDESTFSEILCLMCGSPFSESELQNLESTKHKAQKKIDLYTAHCCQSCYFQILPAGENLNEHFFSLLPKLWTGKMDTISDSHSLLRDQIEEYLLEENDDGN
ncbi:cytoplasmic tRNA 2-thiolation protein 2 [Oryza glaberrima]|uniref:Cytoplasmic tRNA 2-thiolation protein 2 n=1 Tax=Oryza glaberrima TaxID=4538 RepID=I1R7I3_ORYGL|nr:cytoplasmic tRNA 2-thiolation protein 2 [Oryza glaberrima]